MIENSDSLPRATGTGAVAAAGCYHNCYSLQLNSIVFVRDLCPME